jgi:hypothetical protein
LPADTEQIHEKPQTRITNALLISITVWHLLRSGDNQLILVKNESSSGWEINESKINLFKWHYPS